MKNFFKPSYYQKKFLFALIIISVATLESSGQILVDEIKSITATHEVCVGQGLLFYPKNDSFTTFKWEINPGTGWINAGTSKALYYAFETEGNYFLRLSSTIKGVSFIDTILISSIKCCSNPQGIGAARQTIFYDDFGTLDLASDSTGKTYKIWDYDTDPLNPKQITKTTATPFRWPLTQPPIGATFVGTQGSPIVDGQYTVASYITNTQPYKGIKGSLLQWAGNITGPVSNPPISYDHSGKVEGAALLLNNPFNSKGLVVYKKDITNLCTVNGKTIFFECYIAVFTISPNGVNVTLRLTGGDAPVEITGVASKEGSPGGGKWVRIAGSTELIGNTLTIEVINNAPNEWDQAGNDLVIDDIKVSTCAPPNLHLFSNPTTYAQKVSTCDTLTLSAATTANFVKYYNSTPTYLYQWSTTPLVNTSWKNLDTAITKVSKVKDIKILTTNKLAQGDKAYFRVVAGSAASISTPPTNGFNQNNPCRNYSVSDPIEATVKCTILSTQKSYEDQLQLLFPNPGKDIVSFKGKATSYAVYNNFGSKVLDINNTVLNISTLESGIYQVIVTDSDGKTFSQKLVKE